MTIELKPVDEKAVTIIQGQMAVILQTMNEQNKKIMLADVVRMSCHFYENKDRVLAELAQLGEDGLKKSVAAGETPFVTVSTEVKENAEETQASMPDMRKGDA